MPSKLPLLPNPKYHKSGLKSYVHLIRKYSFHPTKPGPYFIGSVLHQTGRPFTNKPIGGRASIRQVLQKRKAEEEGQEVVGSVEAGDVQNEFGHLVEVSIGSPAQRVRVGVDTGLADFWVSIYYEFFISLHLSTEMYIYVCALLMPSKQVWSAELPTSILSQHHGHNVFDASKSSTFKPVTAPPSTWMIRYLDGSSASGIVGTDTADLGELVIKDQPIQLADSISPGFIQSEGDGILGLGFRSSNNITVKMPVQNLLAAQEEDIPKSAQVFTAKLGSWTDEPFYTFGFIDEDTVQASGQEEIYYTPVDNSQGFWAFDSTSATINGKTMAQRTGNKAIADTGSSLTLLDDDTCQAIYNAIPGAIYDTENQGYIFPSDITEDKLPTVSVGVGEKEFVLRKEELRFADAEGKPGYVYGGVQSRGSLGFDVFGLSFLRGVYAVRTLFLFFPFYISI